ncbi:hypothetical protein KSP40_PGU014617 [Platanthera guangdongensis]|uniref:Ubiquitin-like protease family profile domain-containing protein n=1 Tax=Platanthera guangdongensis TaxID=2320717 RepID=A0ABR2ME90_9ASPA
MAASAATGPAKVGCPRGQPWSWPTRQGATPGVAALGGGRRPLDFQAKGGPSRGKVGPASPSRPSAMRGRGDRLLRRRSQIAIFPKMPGSKYLSSRCSSKSFTEHVTPLPPSALKALQEDALHAFPEGFIDWPVVDARKSPQQSNSYDCGVFVIKYMEVVTSFEDVTWQDHQG